MVFGRKDDDGQAKTVEIRTASGECYRINDVPSKTVGKMTSSMRWANLHPLQFPVEGGSVLFFPPANIEVMLINDAPVDAGEGVYTYLEDEEEDE